MGALILNRKQGDALMIGDDIEVKILSVTKGDVRVAITAPKHIPVHRSEIYDLIKRQEAEKRGVE